MLKFIFAFGVIAIHTDPTVKYAGTWIARFVDAIVQMGVPFFFISSGFLLGRKLLLSNDSRQNDVSIIQKYCIKIIKMYVIWMMVYTPFAIVFYIKEGYSVIKSMVAYVIGFLFVGQQYNNWVLWYLLSTVYAVLFICFLVRHGIKEWHIIITIVFASVLVALFGFIGHAEYNYTGSIAVAQKIIRRVLSSGRIFMGYVYIPMGILLSKKRMPLVLSWILLIIGFAGRLLIDNEIVVTYLLIISSIGLFEIIERINLSDSKVYSNMRNMSTTIYLIHLIIWTAYYMVIYKTKTFGLDCFLAVSALSTVVALVYLKFTKRMQVTK